MTPKAIIIGAGQLGSRHLQGLSRSRHGLSIDVVDPSPDRLLDAQARYREIPAGNSDIALHGKIPHGGTYDLAVISTSSLPRAQVTRELLQKNDVRHIVFEKVLFPIVEEYHDIGNLLKTKGVKAWVNCPYRMYPHWQKIRSLLSGPLHVTVCGGEWGMGTNSIHIVDLVAWITGENAFEWNTSSLDPAVHPSKRPGYAELSGLLQIRGEKGSTLHLYSQQGGAPFSGMTFINENTRVDVCQKEGTALVHERDKGWKCERHSFDIPYQSVLSGVVADDILEGGECPLPEYEFSAKLHIPMIEAFGRHLRHVRRLNHDEKSAYLNIT